MTITDSRSALAGAIPNAALLGATYPRPTNVDATPAQGSSGESSSPAATSASRPISSAPQGIQTTGGRGSTDTQAQGAAGSNVPGPAAETVTTSEVASLLDPALCLAADILDDLERVRIANENRLRQLTRTGEDKDGEERGFGLDESHPDVARLAAMVATLKQVEHDATLNLQRKVRRHPLGMWAKGQRGVGEKQIARLLAAIGDPYINSAKGEPRTVSALWAYSGLHVLPGGPRCPDAQLTSAAGDQLRDTGPGSSDDHCLAAGVAAKRRKGERANWSTNAKMRAYLIAESCIKQLGPDCRDGHVPTDTRGTGAVPVQAGEQDAGQATLDTHRGTACACSPYRVVYDRRRAHTAVTHPEWTDGHSHNDALRVASKEILKHLWRAAREWHLTQEAA